MIHEGHVEATRQRILRVESAPEFNFNGMAAHLHENFHWLGDRLCGTGNGLEAVRGKWEPPLRAASELRARPGGDGKDTSA